VRTQQPQPPLDCVDPITVNQKKGTTSSRGLVRSSPRQAAGPDPIHHQESRIKKKQSKQNKRKLCAIISHRVFDRSRLRLYTSCSKKKKKSSSLLQINNIADKTKPPTTMQKS
jgi:hypothetical protein